ncbi:TAXI family TRAP transporter solute-binding subunit [Amorphus orientalis]|uniref:TRAP transporter TAXI family solute receptor n=1 Tax=Amorphus orientalis TaxID=649198 RepID=A0AAE3VQZ2_9HYPH|nr:TAXI family TRAP transporter solute-binding subunit [Amorphus orientalis]MDQ0316353.1 TRAP transporter TAXI family solute receptor [Amorphus orientalis]
MYRKLLTGLSAAALTLAMGAGAQAQQAAIGTLPQGALGYSIAAGVANVITQFSDLTSTAVPTGGSNVVLPQVNNGEMEFATSNTVEAVYAVTGTGNFEGRPLENLQVAAVLMPFTVGVVVREDSEYQSAADLKGQPFPTDYSAQKFVEMCLKATLAAEGLSVEDFEPVSVPNFARAVDLMVADRVAGAYSAPGSGVIRQADADVGVRFIGIKPTPDGEKAMQKIAPGSYFAEVEPSPAAAGVKEPVTLLGYEYTLMVGADVPEDTVYQAVKALYENPDALSAAHGIFRRWDPERIYIPLDAPYHPGAMKFYREIGLAQ